MARGVRLVSVYEYIGLRNLNDILSIRDSKQTVLQTMSDNGSYALEDVPSFGEIVVDVGFICGRLHSA